MWIVQDVMNNTLNYTGIIWYQKEISDTHSTNYSLSISLTKLMSFSADN